MNQRRQLIVAALAAAFSPQLLRAASPAEDAAAAIERLRVFYGSLKSYTGLARSSADGLGSETPGEVRAAFVAPGRLCMQMAQNGEVLTCQIADGDVFEQWSRKKNGWRTITSFDVLLAGLRGAGVTLGPFPYWLALLLFDSQRSEPEGLRALTGATCSFHGNQCERLEGLSGETQVTVELDAKGAVRGVQSENKRTPFEISVKAEIESRFNPVLDMDKLLTALRRKPQATLPI